MCANYYLVKSPHTEALAENLGVDQLSFRYGDFKPASTVSIVLEDQGKTVVREATWWLYLEQTETGLKPNQQYFSVNSNYAKLPKRPEYRKSRCIVPATGFVESQDGKHPHLLEPVDNRCIAFGGLYKRWQDHANNIERYSMAIITLKGHPALQNIHRKSTPLWLPSTSYREWLSSDIKDTEVFKPLLEPSLITDLRATPIDKVMKKNPVGKDFVVRSDEY